LSRFPTESAFLRASSSPFPLPQSCLASSSRSSFIVQASFPILPGFIFDVLIDCGASDIFMDPSLAAQFHSSMISPISDPVTLFLFDGSQSPSGPITEMCCSEVLIGNSVRQKLEFLITELHPSVKVVLGLRWLQQYNPVIDWQAMTMTLPGHSPALDISTPADLSGPSDAVKASHQLSDSRADPCDLEARVLRDLSPWEDVPISVPQDHGEQGRNLSLPGSKPHPAARGRSSMPARLCEFPSRTYTVAGHPIDFAVSAPQAPLDPLAPRDPSRLSETLRALRQIPVIDSPKESSRKRKKEPPSEASDYPRPKREAPKISLVGAPAFARLMVGNQCAMSAAFHV